MVVLNDSDNGQSPIITQHLVSIRTGTISNASLPIFSVSPRAFFLYLCLFVLLWGINKPQSSDCRCSSLPICHPQIELHMYTFKTLRVWFKKLKLQDRTCTWIPINMCSLLLEFLTEFPFPNTILHDVQIYKISPTSWLGVDPTSSFLPINSSSLRSDKIITVLFISFLLL